MTNFEVITKIGETLPSPARREEPSGRPLLRVGAVQCAWDRDADRHKATLAEGIRLAANQGASVICLQELTLSRYIAVRPDDRGAAQMMIEDLEQGPTAAFTRRMAAEVGAVVHASLYERDDNGPGFNTAIAVEPGGRVIARTRKMHIPGFPYYHEDHYFAAGDTGFPVVDVNGVHFGFPTCWDQWFPELARIYSLSGAEVLVYPTAIGSEPHLEGFDTEPLWRHMITANGLANATFMVAINRIGSEGPLTFYGSSFISDPYGRVIVEASRDRPAVLVADLDLDQRRDWLTFGLMSTRRPDQYQQLVNSPHEGHATQAAQEASPKGGA
ncbi:MAG: hydrolase [Gammaproteobacteria bacterium]|nr:hydrolase [Gammaproteobacteria bacterium]